MQTKLDAALAPQAEAALTPYDKAARLFLEYAIAGKLGPFDLTDQAANSALEAEMLAHEAALANGISKPQVSHTYDAPKAEPVKADAPKGALKEFLPAMVDLPVKVLPVPQPQESATLKQN